jgi:hypothetical protein
MPQLLVYVCFYQDLLAGYFDNMAVYRKLALA